MSLSKDVLYILENDDIEFKHNGKKYKNTGLINFIRLYKFIPDGITIIRKRRKNMSKVIKTKKAPAKATKKATAKKPAKATTPTKAVKAPAKKSK